jgi:hypothetical protein
MGTFPKTKNKIMELSFLFFSFLFFFYYLMKNSFVLLIETLRLQIKQRKGSMYLVFPSQNIWGQMHKKKTHTHTQRGQFRFFSLSNSYSSSLSCVWDVYVSFLFIDMLKWQEERLLGKQKKTNENS